MGIQNRHCPQTWPINGAQWCDQWHYYLFSSQKQSNSVTLHSSLFTHSLTVLWVVWAPTWCLWLRYVSFLPCWSLGGQWSGVPRVQMRPRSPKRCVLTPGVWAERLFRKASYSERRRLRTKWRVWPTKTVAAQAFGTSSSKNPVRQHSLFNYFIF